MRDIFIYSASFACLALVLFALARAFDRRLTLAACALAALYLGFDDLATVLGPRVAPLGGDWNWSGKACSLALAIAVAVAFRIGPRALGVQLPRGGVRASLVLMLALLAASIGLALAFDPQAPSAETLAFQATMPGLAEELAYRGVAPALLLGLAGGRATPSSMPWAVICATALMFGAWHGLGYARGAFSFECWRPMSPRSAAVKGPRSC